MFSGEIQKRLALMQSELVTTSSTAFCLQEKEDSGYAKLELHVNNPCILFRSLEKKKLNYFINQKCADYVIFECRDNQWYAHILELKRTISEKSWSLIKQQFAGAMQNVLALAGILGITIEPQNTELYSVYRNDKINDYANPVRVRMTMHENQRNTTDWNEENIILDFLEERQFEHHKLPLDVEHGTGVGEIKL